MGATVTASGLSPRDSHLRALVALPIVLLLWVLPFHAVTIAFFFGFLRTGMQATMIMASWKEGVAIILLAIVAMRAILTRGPRVGIVAPDVAITGLIALAVLFAIAENPIFNAQIPFNVQVFGFRSSVFFMVLYYVGRGVPEIGEHSTYVKHLFRVAVVVALIGVLERIFVSPRMLVALGAASYVNDFLGLTASTVGNDYGLPSNYWSVLGRVPVRRAGSVFLGGQAFAIPFLLLMPAATSWVFEPSKRLRLWSLLGYVVIWLGLLVTITRTTIIVCALQVLVYFLITRRPTRVVGAALTSLSVFLAALILVPGLAAFVLATLTFQTSSSYSHVNDWRRGLTAFFERPWGHGLGSSDQVAQRFGRTPLTADNLFLGYAVDLGAIGLVAFIAVLFTVGVLSWRLFKNSSNPGTRMVAATVFLTNLGIVLNGTSSVPFNSVFLAYNFFLLVGAAVTVYERRNLQPGAAAAE
ncbi:MAG: O-antigen ligase family protein [Gemmatimonadaceae bacterium]